MVSIDLLNLVFDKIRLSYGDQFAMQLSERSLERLICCIVREKGLNPQCFKCSWAGTADPRDPYSYEPRWASRSYVIFTNHSKRFRVDNRLVARVAFHKKKNVKHVRMNEVLLDPHSTLPLLSTHGYEASHIHQDFFHCGSNTTGLTRRYECTFRVK